MPCPAATRMMARLAVLAAVLLFSSATLAKDLGSVQLMVPHNPPITVLDAQGTARGVVAETTALILEQMGFTVTAAALPLDRIYPGLKNGQVEAAVSVLATPERMMWALFPDPILTEYAVLLVRPSLKDRIRHLSALQDLRVGGRTGFRYPRLGCTQENALIRLPSDRALAEALHADTLDAALVGSLGSMSRLREAGLLKDLAVVDAAVDTVPITAALSRERFSDSDLAAFNNRLKRLRESPIWEDILSRNGVPISATQRPLLPH